MDWCRLSTSYYLDAALLRAGEAAEVLYLRCLSYSGACESRGRIPVHALPMLTPTRTKARLASLLREGLLIEDGQDVLIRSWEKWQEALDTESERREKDRIRKAEKRAAERAMSQDVSADSPRTVRSKSARIEVEVEEELQTSSVVGRKRATATPDLFPITDAMKIWGAANCPNVLEPQQETRQFLDHHRAKGSTFKDWTAAWRTWMTNAQRFAVRDGVKPTSFDPSKEYLRSW